MASDWILNFDSAPFCNGSLHIGHARNYVLGDVRARWLRLRGAHCRYVTALDAFGLPNAASTEGATRTANAERIRRQLCDLGLAHSALSPSTTEPGYYRWTQWLFLELWSAGLVYWKNACVHYCTKCATVLASSQSDGGKCWRCAGPVDQRRERAGYIRTSVYQSELTRSIDALSGWSDRARKLLRAAMDDGRTMRGAGDWVVSRNHTWGTPVPAVDCATCGVVPVRRTALPILHAVHGGSRHHQCMRCGGIAPLVDQTLDCFFDDSWCFYAGARDWKPGNVNPFVRWREDPPLAVHFHAGYDTYAYLPLYRFIGRFLWKQGYSPKAEPVDFYHGHDVVTSDGHKVSKRYGNGPDLDALLLRYGADTLRLSVLAGVNPSRPLEWSDGQLQIASRFYRVATRLREHCGPGLVTGRIPSIGDARPAGFATVAAIDDFIDSYRMAAALDRLYNASRARLRSPATAGNAATLHALLSRWLLFCPQLADSARLRRAAVSTPMLTRQTA